MRLGRTRSTGRRRSGAPRVVVVTGASAGLGRAIAHKFGARGDRVALLARDEERLARAVKEIKSAGGEARAIPVDVADAAAVDAAAASAEQEFVPRRHRRVGQQRDDGAKHAMKGFTESVRTELMYEHSNVRITMVQMPALNTPQFDWVLSHLPNRAQPLPPIFQPEVGAQVVVHAADHYRREYRVGWPTMRAIVGNAVIPGVLDRLLARTGVSSQQTDEPRPPDQPANLWEPVPGDWGAHGRFDDDAREHSWAVRFVLARDRLGDAVGASRMSDALAERAARVLAKWM